MKQTLALKATLRAIDEMTAEGEPIYGYPLLKRTGLQSGGLYPILARLERYGWLTSEWETQDAASAGRPRRRVYRKGENWSTKQFEPKRLQPQQ